MSIQTSEFSVNDRVFYVPMHANGDISHPDVEHGKVSSTNERFVFVKFDKQVLKLGWQGTTAQPCDPRDLRKETSIE